MGLELYVTYLITGKGRHCNKQHKPAVFYKRPFSYYLCLPAMEEKDFLVEKVGKCVVITMDLGENRINANFIRAMHKALDAAER